MLFSTIFVPSGEPQPSPFSGGLKLSDWLSWRRIKKLLSGEDCGSDGSTNSILCNHGNRFLNKICLTADLAVWNLCVISKKNI